MVWGERDWGQLRSRATRARRAAGPGWVLAVAVLLAAGAPRSVSGSRAGPAHRGASHRHVSARGRARCALFRCPGALQLRGGDADGAAGNPSPEGPLAPRPGRAADRPSLLDAVAGPELPDAGDGDSDSVPEDRNFRAALRQHALTTEERDDFFAQLYNDTRWANVTLCPLLHGEETPEEIQWEEERLHGDLNLYRRTWVPTPKFLAWKAAEDRRAAELELARAEAIQSADEISMSSSATSDSEPNWYFANTDEGERRLMWRPAYGKQEGGGDAYIPFPADRADLIDPSSPDEELPAVRFEWMGQDVRDIVDNYLSNEKCAMERVLGEEAKVREQIRKRSPAEAECMRLVDHLADRDGMPEVCTQGGTRAQGTAPK